MYVAVVAVMMMMTMMMQHHDEIIETEGLCHGSCKN